MTLRDRSLGSRSNMCRWKVERKVRKTTEGLANPCQSMKKDQTSCSSASPPVPHSPAASRPSCSLPATASTTPPSSSGSLPSTLATTDSSWSSTHQTLRLLQNRFVASSAKNICVYIFKIYAFQAAAVCLSSGSWGPTHHLACVDASQLGKGWMESASLSINIIYILLALLTVLTVPLLLLHCCGRRLCSSCPRWLSISRTISSNHFTREPKKQPEEAIWSPGGDPGSPPSPSSPLPSSNPSGSGLYSVSSGLVIQPATVG